MQTIRSLKKLKPYLRPFLGMIIVGALLGILLSAIRTSLVPMVEFFGEDVLANKEPGKLIWIPVFLVGMYLINFPIRFAHYYMLRVVTAKVNQKLKDDLFKHLLTLSADYFTFKSSGQLISRVGNDPQHVDGGIASINVLIREPTKFFILFGWTLYYNWRLTIITLIVFPLFAWVFSFTGKAMKRYIHRMQQENAEYFSRIQESFSGIRIIKIFQLEKFSMKKSREPLHKFTETSLKTAKVQEASHPLIELLIGVGISGVLFYGGREVYAGQMTGGELLAFFTAVGMMMDPIQRLNDVNIKVNQAAGAIDRIFEVFSWKPNVASPEHPIPKETFDREISFNSIRFAYPDEPDREVIKGISFNIQKNEVVALVGESGSGKSSLAGLIPRLYDVTGGSIEIDGIDIRKLSIERLRKMVSLVSQDIFLFNTTIEENIRCGRLSASKKEIEEAAVQAHALEFIRDLPDGMQTIIGERGQVLSGGQRQRLSIARAILSNAPILILDEATSALDSASEKVVQQAIEELMQNRTSLVIAHRLSTIRFANRIIVLKEGEIQESGTHEELIQSGGEYARFLRIGEGPA